MKVFFRDRWIGGLSEYSDQAGGVRLRVTRWLTLERADGQYFERPRSLRMIANYMRELGPQQVWRKVRSRSAERVRNDKYLSVGIGIDPTGGARLFIATSHPGGVDRLVVPDALTRSVPTDTGAGADLRRAVGEQTATQALRELIGWSPFAGMPLDRAVAAAALDDAAGLLAAVTTWSEPVPLASETPTAPTGPPQVPSSARSAMLFGFGNYAKLYILPNIAPHLRVIKIAEIDPTQIPLTGGPDVAWTTDPEPRPDDRFDVFFAASYHHTHAPVAIHAIEQGAAAVIEKPVVTDEAQLDALVTALDRHNGRFFACFHKRYTSLTKLAQWDLAAPRGAPIDYHCAVYEVPLPARHWYRWPNSRSRIISNGCHWIDHFLFLNDYAAPTVIDGTMAPNGTINCTIVLQNGALFSMALTEVGSERLGVRDYIELRHGDVTVRMTDSSRYHAENSQRVLRTTRITKTDSYRDMYRVIAQRIVAGSPGDSRDSIVVGSRTILDVEQMFRDRYPGHFLAAPPALPLA